MSGPPQDDLLILGAGPAGCAAAIAGCRRGLRVVMLEAGDRDREAPGETLHPGIEPLLRALGLDATLLAQGFHRHRGVWSEWGGPRHFTAYGADANGPWLGFQVARRRFNAMLRDAAVAAGARLHRSTRPDAILLDGSRIAGVRADGREFAAAWTLDATGRRAWLARAMSLPGELRSAPLQLRFGWRPASSDDLAEPSITARSQGWNWQAPIGSGRVAWVTLRARPRNNASGASDFAWRLHADCAGPGYMLLGDAAALLDPSASHGVLNALMSGMLAAHLAAGRRDGRLSDRDAAAAYRSWVHDRFEGDVAALELLYRRHPAGPMGFGLR